MRLQTIVATIATIIGTGVTPVLAQNGPHIGGWPSPAEQQALTREPGYSIGTGSAHLRDGSSPNDMKNHKPLAPGNGNSTGAVSAQTPGK